jgi:hypothetical protein
MTQRLVRLLPAIVACAALWPASAEAAGNLPISLAIGVYQPTTTNIAYPNYPVAYNQNSGFSAEVSFGPVFESGVQFSVLGLTTQDHGSLFAPNGGPICGCPSSFTITQVPVLFETTSAKFGSFRIGGGLGYDFSQVPTGTGLPSGSGVVGDTFAQLGLGSSLALEGKYIFGTQAGLGGFFVGVSTKL